MFWSDNTAALYVNTGVETGIVTTANTSIDGGPTTTPDSATGSPTTYSLAVTGGTSYTVDLDVYNIPNSGPNPTGANIQFTETVVPEPSTYALLGIGGLALFIVSRRCASKVA